MPLTPKQKRFVEEYLVDLIATQAYIRAGYKARGNAAESAAARLLRNVQVAEAIEKARAKLSERNELTVDEVVAGLRWQANRMDNGSSHAACVRAWELLGDRLGMFPKKHEHSGPNGKPIPHEHQHSGTVAARIDALAAAFEGAANRAGQSHVPGDDTGKPVDS